MESHKDRCYIHNKSFATTYFINSVPINKWKKERKEGGKKRGRDPGGFGFLEKPKYIYEKLVLLYFPEL
jgi:hypothetical protein